MATAPEPGIGRRREATAQAQQVTTLRIRENTYTIATGNVPIRVKDRFLRQTGRSIEWLATEERLGDVTVAALWYMARMLNGDLQLEWETVLDEWDDANFTIADIDVTTDEPEGDDPEA